MEWLLALNIIWSYKADKDVFLQKNTSFLNAPYSWQGLWFLKVHTEPFLLQKLTVLYFNSESSVTAFQVPEAVTPLNSWLPYPLSEKSKQD